MGRVLSIHKCDGLAQRVHASPLPFLSAYDATASRHRNETPGWQISSRMRPDPAVQICIFIAGFIPADARDQGSNLPANLPRGGAGQID